MNTTQEVLKINVWLDLFTFENVGNVAALLVLALVIISVIRAVIKQDGINLLDMFLPLGSSKMRLNGTWVIAMWTVVIAALHRSNDLVALLGLILTAFVTDRMMSRKDSKLTKKPDEPEDTK